MIIKNSNLRKQIVENRYKILVVIITIILFFLVKNLLNEIAKQNAKTLYSNETNTIQQSIKPQETVVYGSNISTKQQENNDVIIKDFIDACNENKIEEAYNLLSESCKEKVFNSQINSFENNYVKPIFETKKVYSIQSWITNIGYTYKINILDDVLASGNINSDAIVDYYTIIMEDDQYKLNINNYIGNTKLNKTVENENIKVDITDKDIYVEYEVYNFKIENKTDKTILVDSKENVDSIYMVGENKTKYPAYMYELTKQSLLVNSKISKAISIKFNKRYATRTKMEYIVFSEVIKDYEAYNNYNENVEYKDKFQISITL